MPLTPKSLKGWADRVLRRKLFSNQRSTASGDIPQGKVLNSDEGNSVAAPIAARAHIDSVFREEVNVVVAGWAISPDGSPPVSVHLDCDQISGVDHSDSDVRCERVARPDVRAAFSHASQNCGFRLSFPVQWLISAHARHETAAMRLRIVSADGISDAELDASVLTRFQEMLLDAAAQLPSIPEHPHMPIKAVERFEQVLRGAHCYLEFGTGGTTMAARRLGVTTVIGVESDWLWLESLRLNLNEDGLLPEGIHLLHIDIGPTGAWGYPISDACWKQFRDYPLRPWEYCIERGLTPDVVLIDGRFRCACFLATCLLAAPGTRVLFDDYLDRPQYHVVERFLKPVASFDRVAEFLVPADLPRQAMWLLLSRALSDPG